MSATLVCVRECAWYNRSQRQLVVSTLSVQQADTVMVAIVQYWPQVQLGLAPAVLMCGTVCRSTCTVGCCACVPLSPCYGME